MLDSYFSFSCLNKFSRPESDTIGSPDKKMTLMVDELSVYRDYH